MGSWFSGLLALEAVGVDEGEFQDGFIEEAAGAEAMEFEEFCQIEFSHHSYRIFYLKSLALLEGYGLENYPLDSSKSGVGELCEVDQFVGLHVALIYYAPFSTFRRASCQIELEGIVGIVDEDGIEIGFREMLQIGRLESQREQKNSGASSMGSMFTIMGSISRPT